MSFSPVWPPTVAPSADASGVYVLSKRKLGDGSYSTVFECKNTVTGSHYAAKMYSKKLIYGLESAIRNEFQILQRISMIHPNVLTLVDHFESDDSLYLVTDLAAGGELFERVTSPPSYKLTEDHACHITRTLVGTVEYLHSNRIVHRDLKAENLLFHSKSSYDILVADFGLARLLEPGQRLHDVTGTLSYMAPEMFDREHGHGLEVDIWAVGVIVYFMLCGYMPFDCETDQETRDAIAHADYPYEPREYWDPISPEAKSFIDACLQLEGRPTAHELNKHPWISGDDGAQNSHAPTDSETSPAHLAKLRESVMLLQQKQGLRAPVSPLRLRGAAVSSDSVFSDPFSGHRPGPGPVFHQPVKLSTVENGRKNSLVEGATLQGAWCKSPEKVSRFTTPVSSAAVSRQHSSEKIVARKAVGMGVSRSEETPHFFL